MKKSFKHAIELFSVCIQFFFIKLIVFQMIYKTTQINCENNGQKIYGVLYKPEIEGKIPLAIYAHGCGSTLETGIKYAEQLASNGVATYLFDFRGGGTKSRSDGKTTEMSVMTESSDLVSVISQAKKWDFVDTNKVILIGASQGGMASAVTSERNPNETVGLILLYPAFVIQDDNCKPYSSPDEVPEIINIKGWINVGKNYVTDIWDYDLYGEMKHYTKPVLIIHGSDDNVVNTSYSQRAVESYPNAELHIIQGAGHGFSGESLDEAVKQILIFLKKLEFIK